MKKALHCAWAATIAACFALGCDSGSSTAGAGSPYSFYITDDLTTGYSSVVVNLHKVELKGADGSVTVLDSLGGIQVDLRALNNGQSLFMALGSKSVPAGTYNRIEVIAAKGLSLTATGTTTPTAAQFIDALDAGAGRSKLEMNLTPPVVSDGTAGSMVIDFDLSRWTFAAGRVTPFLARHNGIGLDDSGRHFNRPFEGTIRGLQGTIPNQTFTLIGLEAGDLKVETSADTAIYRDNGSPNPILSNGIKVKVTGVLDPATRSIKARAIKIDGVEHGDESEAKGPVLEVNAGDFRFLMGVRFGIGLPLEATRLKVQTSESTLFFSRSGLRMSRSDFFTALSTTSFVEAEGTFNAGAGVLTAKKVKFDNESHGGGGGGHEAEAKGSTRDRNPSAGTFIIILSEWEGFQAVAGSGLSVKVAEGAAFKSPTGESITQARFFELLAGGAIAKAKGSYSASGLLATRLEARS